DADAGQYMVIVTNIAGAVSNAVSLGIAVPPSIDAPPQNLTILSGQNASFTIAASGTRPLGYQWLFSGTNVADGTGAALTLTNVSPDQAGAYMVVVTNIAGAASNSATLSVYTSASATLSAVPSLSGSQFQFTVSGVPGFSYVVEASTNFTE